MASKRETVLAAVKSLVAAALPGAEVKRNLAKAERIPPGGLVVIRDGDPGEPEVSLSPLTYLYSHRIPLEIAAYESATLTREQVLDAMADTVTPQGFVAVARQFPTSIRDILTGSPTLVAVLEEVRDPGNAGTIIRAADSAGADAVILTGRTVDLYNPKVVRSTTGSLFHLPFSVGGDLNDVVSRAHDAGLQVLAADVKGDDLLAARAEGVLERPTAWLFGNEARGLEDDMLDLADRALKLPIYGRAESLNLATAASVIAGRDS